MDFRHLSPKDKKVLHVSWHLELSACVLSSSVSFWGLMGFGEGKRVEGKEKTTFFHTFSLTQPQIFLNDPSQVTLG